ncbi:MAG: hypothetical protein R3D85_11140 [Paracoccaceae bacterium]
MKAKILIGAASLGITAALWAMPAAAEMPIFAYASKENHCPAGMQPIILGGVICCGVPNQSISYQAQNNPGGGHRVKRKAVRRVASTYCPETMKGCVSR